MTKVFFNLQADVSADREARLCERILSWPSIATIIRLSEADSTGRLYAASLSEKANARSVVRQIRRLDGVAQATVPPPMTLSLPE